jgi:hypothetical protein
MFTNASTMISFEEGNYDDINAWRNGYKWSVNECLQLEREYDLLKMSVPDMALKHNRTLNAIMFKLQAEGLCSYNDAYIKTFGQNFIDEQIDKLNNLCTTKYDEEEDVSEDEQNDQSDDEDYVPNLDESESEDDEVNDDLEEEDFDDGSSKTYVFNQIKRIHKHINNILSYFSNPKASNKEQEQEEEEIVF